LHQAGVLIYHCMMHGNMKLILSYMFIFWFLFLRIRWDWLRNTRKSFILCFVHGACRCNCLKKNQLDAQIIRSIFRQPLHVSGESMPIIRRYNRTYTAVGTYYSF